MREAEVEAWPAIDEHVDVAVFTQFIASGRAEEFLRRGRKDGR